MAYCNNCGNSIGDERFCTSCGADNGEKPTELKPAVQKIKIDRALFMHCGEVLIFVILALVNAISCIKGAERATLYSAMLPLGILWAVIYFIIGFWAVFPAISYALRLKSLKYKPPMVAATVAFGIELALLILRLVMHALGGGFVAVAELFSAYTDMHKSIMVAGLCTVLIGVLVSKELKKQGGAEDVLQ